MNNVLKIYTILAVIIVVGTLGSGITSSAYLTIHGGYSRELPTIIKIMHYIASIGGFNMWILFIVVFIAHAIITEGKILDKPNPSANG